MASRLTRYWRFSRPFTLLVPATGMVAAALAALGADPKWISDWTRSVPEIVARIGVGAIMAAALNVFSNGINQIFDLEIDRINKPSRPLPSGEMSTREAWIPTLFGLAVAVGLAGWLNLQCLLLVVGAGLLTCIYSAPPLRTKCRGWLANVTIAIPRGTLLMVAGWASIKSVWSHEPWLIGLVFGFYFLGAVTTKDFSDVEGDRALDCRTLPVIYGSEKAIRLISPFLVLPFLMILPATYLGLLTGNALILTSLGVALTAWGIYIARLLTATAGNFAAGGGGAENHPSWKHMYLLTVLAQFGFSAAYLLS